MEGASGGKGAKEKKKREQKAHRPAPLVGRGEVAGYENPGGFFFERARTARESNPRPPGGEVSAAEGHFAPARAPPHYTTGALGGAGDRRNLDQIYIG